jgi:hypothetical protein
MLFIPVAGYEHGVLIGGNFYACLQARQVQLFIIKSHDIFVYFPTVYVCLVSRYLFYQNQFAVAEELCHHALY